MELALFQIPISSSQTHQLRLKLNISSFPGLIRNKHKNDIKNFKDIFQSGMNWNFGKSSNLEKTMS